MILPDIATCADCRREIFDPSNRRYLYPFTNCTNCGPRFSIIESLPYDRPNTVMKKFAMCPDCEREYHDPAQPPFPRTAQCVSELRSATGIVERRRSDRRPANRCLVRRDQAIRAGQIVALKGIGGFQLLVDARNEDAVRRLRERKQREDKPFAVMFPSLEAVRSDCVSELEARLLRSPEAPIVLLERDIYAASSTSCKPTLKRRECRAPAEDGEFIASSVAPRNPFLGAMLPYSPLHHILLRELGFPVVATSGNLSDEPICIDEHEALERLRGIADVFLVHNRPIVRQVDDSVARVLLGREQVLRRARGYAPLPVHLKSRTCRQFWLSARI